MSALLRGMNEEVVRLGQEVGVLGGRWVSELVSALNTLVTGETRGIERRQLLTKLNND